MMVALFVYAYAIGVRSSRAIERRCHDDVAFRVITANQAPDHATIARFRVRHEAAIAELFGEVLALCARSGLVKVGVVAVDGTKIAAAATHHATRDYEQIAREILEDAARIDAAEDELFGEARGDELPEGLRTSGDRRKVLREAKQALEAERAARGQEDPARPQRAAGRVPAAVASGLGARAPRRQPSTPRGMRPGSPATGRGGWSARATTSSPIRSLRAGGQDQRHRSRLAQPQDDARVGAGLQRPGRRRRRPDRARRRDQHRVAGHRQPAADDRDRHRRARRRRASPRRPGWCWPTPATGRTTRSRRSAARASRRSSRPTPTAAKSRGPGAAAAAMTSRAACSRPTGANSSTSSAKARVEPVFGQIKSNRGADRFQRRGRSAVRSEWRLLTATHNLLKLHRHQLATA